MKTPLKNYSKSILFFVIAIICQLPLLIQAQTQFSCASYAQTAVAQNQQNLSNNLGLTGPRWNSDYSRHYDWCMRVSEQSARDETIARIEALMERGVEEPEGIAPFTISLKSITCLKESGEIGAEEPYVICTVIDLGPNMIQIEADVMGNTVPIRVDSSVLLPRVNAVLYGPFKGINAGETKETFYGLPPEVEFAIRDLHLVQVPIWGSAENPVRCNHPDQLIIIVSLLENDHGNPNVTRTFAESAAVSTAAATVNFNRNDRVARFFQSIHSMIATPSSSTLLKDDRIGTTELRLTFDDLLPRQLGTYEKILYFPPQLGFIENDEILYFGEPGGTYKLVFEFNRY